jgi:hypothetical protein
MEVQFTPEQEARILQIANYNGSPLEQLVKQAVRWTEKAFLSLATGLRA